MALAAYLPVPPLPLPRSLPTVVLVYKVPLAVTCAPPQELRPLVAHASVLNTRYRTPSVPSAPARDGKQQTRDSPAGEERAAASFDGRKVLELYGGVALNDQPVTSVHLSIRGGKDSGTGYYKCAASISL